MFVINPAELAKQLLRALVEHFRKNDSDLDDEISPLAVPRRRRPPSPDVEPLPGLRPRRHAQARGAVRRRHVDLGAKRRLVHADRNGDVKIVPFARERLVRLDLDGEIEIAGPAAPLAGIPLLRHADARAVADARGNRDRDRLAAHLDAGTAAAPARRLLQASRAAARVAAFREHHAAAARADDAAALAALTARFGNVQSARPATRLTGVAARQRQLPLGSPHRLLEGQRDRCMQIGAAHRLGRLRLLALREHLGEQIAKRRSVRVSHTAGKIEPLELERHRRRHRRQGAGVVP